VFPYVLFVLTIVLSVLFVLTIVLSVLFVLTIVLSVLFRFGASDYPFSIFKLFLMLLPCPPKIGVIRIHLDCCHPDFLRFVFPWFL